MNGSRFVVVALVAAVFGCEGKGKGKDEASAAGSGKAIDSAGSARDERKVDPAALFTGKAPRPSGTLAKVKLGMTEAEALAAAPELKQQRGYLATEDRVYSVDIDDEGKKVTSLKASLDLPFDAAKKLAVAAWGETRDYKYSVTDAVPVWFNPELGVAASLRKGFSDERSELELHAYVPLDALLGTDKTRFGFETTPLLGATVAEVEAAYAPWLQARTAEEAAADRKDLERFAGRDMSVLGAAKASMQLNLPPIETDDFRTTVWLDFEDGKVVRYRFPLSYESHPAAKDEIRARLEQQLGAPTEGKHLLDTIWVFSTSPRIFLTDSDITKDWTITVEAAEKS